MNTKGLRCEIFRWNLGECSNSGISSRVNTVTLVDASGPFEPSPDAPAVKLVRRNIGGREYVHAEPVEDRAGCCMAGGTFIYSCDSRFREAVGNGGYPVSLHDRYEQG